MIENKFSVEKKHEQTIVVFQFFSNNWLQKDQEAISVHVNNNYWIRLSISDMKNWAVEEGVIGWGGKHPPRSA